MPNMDDICAVCGHRYGAHKHDDSCPVMKNNICIGFVEGKEFAPIEPSYVLRVHIAGDWREYKAASIADAEALQGILERAGYPVVVK